jgi:hypothetical protein
VICFGNHVAKYQISATPFMIFCVSFALCDVRKDAQAGKHGTGERGLCRYLCQTELFCGKNPIAPLTAQGLT